MRARSVGGKRDGWMDHRGLNLIRVVIGSYFCAVAVGMPVGYDPSALVKLVLADHVAEVVSSFVLMLISAAFVLGVMLRTSSLMLAGFLIVSSVFSALQGGAEAGLGAVWQSLAFAAAVMLCYGSLKPHEVHKAALISTNSMRGGAARALQKNVAPRRVYPIAGQSKKRREDLARALGPVIAPTDQMIGLANGKLNEGGDKDPRRPKQVPIMEDDPENIFANL